MKSANAKGKGEAKFKKGTNYVTSKKQVSTVEKHVRKPSAQSRLFEYERGQQTMGSKKRPTTAAGKSVSFANHSFVNQSQFSMGGDESLSSTQAQFRHMKSMQDIKKKG